MKNAGLTLSTVSLIALLVVGPSARNLASATEQQPAAAEGGQSEASQSAPSAPGMTGGGEMGGKGMMGGGEMGAKGMMGGPMMGAGMMGGCPGMAMMNADPKTRGQMMEIQGRMMKEMGELMEKRGKELERGSH